MLHPALSAAGIRNAVFDREKQRKMLYFKQVQEHLLINLYDTVKKGFVQVKLSTHVVIRAASQAFMTMHPACLAGFGGSSLHQNL